MEAFIKELSCWLMLVTPHNFLFSFSSLFSLLKLKLLPLRPTDRPDRPLSCQNKQNKSKSFSSPEILTLLCKLILRLPGVELQDLCDSKTRINVKSLDVCDLVPYQGKICRTSVEAAGTETRSGGGGHGRMTSLSLLLTLRSGFCSTSVSRDRPRR